MEQLISYTFSAVLDLMVSEYCRYIIGVMIVIGVFDILYSLTGRGRLKR